MKRHQGLLVLAALGLAILVAGCWGSSKSTSLDVGTVPEPAKVGSASCINTCHAVTPDHITGAIIATTWANAHHTVEGQVQCEDCHGGGGNHFAVGPIPEPNPTTHCAACHGFGTYIVTAHYNADNEPTGLFLQPDAGTEQAVYAGQPEFRPDNVTPVTRAEHIEQCSRCHNPSQQFVFDVDGALVKPNPDGLPQPRVGCGGCHDGHDPAAEIAIVQRTDPAHYPRFRDYLVDAATGAQTDNVAAGVQLSTVNLIYQPNGSIALSGTPDYTRVVGGNNEIHPDRLCAVCHAKGVYLHSGAETHQEDVRGQWATSGHGDRTAAAFGEFSANPGFYDAAFDNGHRVSYPYDMALSASSGVPANTGRNAEGSFACMKCHHGLGSTAYQDNVEGTPEALVLFGDVTVSCVTCHDPHGEVTGHTANTRSPLVMSKYSSGGLNFSGNVFFDNTAVPAATGNATICVFCHQGRESGFALFKRRITGTVTGSFLNPHYLGTGAMLWARNGYEFTDNSTGTPVPKQYGAVAEHQQTNCNGCHMAPGATEEVGGHTWRIVTEDGSVFNGGACNAAACHNGTVPTTNSAGQWDDYVDNAHPAAMRDYDLNNTVESMAREIAGVEDLLLSLLDNNGITYSDTTYPYFFIKGTTSSYTAWTAPQLKAAFNIQFVIKGLPSGASQIGQPNVSAATHNYRYNLQLLMDSYEAVYRATAGVNPALPTPAALLANRPAGSRPATNYANPGSATYDPRQ